MMVYTNVTDAFEQTFLIYVIHIRGSYGKFLGYFMLSHRLLYTPFLRATNFANRVNGSLGKLFSRIYIGIMCHHSLQYTIAYTHYMWRYGEEFRDCVVSCSQANLHPVATYQCYRASQ